MLQTLCELKDSPVAGLLRYPATDSSLKQSLGNFVAAVFLSSTSLARARTLLASQLLELHAAMCSTPPKPDDDIWRLVMRLAATAHEIGLLPPHHGWSALARLLLQPARRWTANHLKFLNVHEWHDVHYSALISEKHLPSSDGGKSTSPGCSFLGD